MRQASIIIPTYNRVERLKQVLQHLHHQTLPFDQFEVIVVDDGSTDTTQSIVSESYDFSLIYLKQENKGATQARNYGATNSSANILIFLDDDIAIYPETLEILKEACLKNEKTIVTGTLYTPQPLLASIFARIQAEDPPKMLQKNEQADDFVSIDFSFCLTGLLAIRREDFFTLNMFQDPTGGWPNWDDIDFGYRASLAGYQIKRACKAGGDHWDYSLTNVQTSCKRVERASRSAVQLAMRHPNILDHLPMFKDKMPIQWSNDPASLIIRKFLRQIVSQRFMLRSLNRIISFLENRFPFPTLLRPLYRWTIGGYIFQGYRAGLQAVPSASS